MMQGTVNPELRARLEQAIRDNPVLLFTKGSKTFPRCGWSKSVIDLFAAMEVPFETVDIFEHPDIRPTLTAITDWPTTPQVFLAGEFLGGGDVVRELHARGELEPLVRAAFAKKPS
jgi:monothiol glutaredoxin